MSIPKYNMGKPLEFGSRVATKSHFAQGLNKQSFFRLATTSRDRPGRSPGRSLRCWEGAWSQARGRARGSSVARALASRYRSQTTFDAAKNLTQAARKRATDARLAGEKMIDPPFQSADAAEGGRLHGVEIEQAAKLPSAE